MNKKAKEVKSRSKKQNKVGFLERGVKMSFEYSKLAGKIKEKFDTQTNFAKELGMSERSLSLKMNNCRAWKQIEMVKACELLAIDINNINEYFFTEKVQKNEQQ